MKRVILALFIFSVCSATLYFGDFINHYETDSTGSMYRADALSTYYSVDEDIRYRLNTHLELVDADDYLGGPAGSSASNLLSGSTICEGGLTYDTGVSALALNFDGRIPSYSLGSSYTPDPDWPDCSSHPNCPGSDEAVYWSNSQYNNYRNDGQLSGGPHLTSSAYTYRSIDYQEAYGDPWFNNEVARVATVAKGTASLRRGSTNIYTFSSLSGTSPSHSGSFSLHPSSYTTYTFTQRMDVDGLLMGVYNFNTGANREDFYSYQSTGGSNPYTESNIHDTGILYVYPDEDVGIIDPYIAYVDIGSDLGGTYEFAPGQTEVPVTVAVYVPDRPDDFYAISFEFSEIEVNPSSLYSFAPTDLDKDCDDPTVMYVGLDPWILGYGQKNGGYSAIFGAHSAYMVDLEGDLTVPADMDSGTHQIEFRVCWESCDGQTVCGGGDADGCSDWFDVPFEIPEEDVLLPDLVCTLEPLEYVTGTDYSDGFEAGEGVQSWRVTVTNIGPGNATIDTENYLCSAVLLNAYNSDGTSSLDPLDFTVQAIFPTALYGILEPGQSSIIDFEDVPAVCIDDSDDTIEAAAAPNWLAWWYPDCVPYQLEEVEYWNNWCTWEAPCNQSTFEEEPGDEYCTIFPTPQTGYPGSHHEFNILCYDDEGDETPCSGTSWAITHGATYVDAFIGNDVGADVDIITDLVVLDEGDSVLIEAAWAGVICEAEILLPPMDCFDFI